VYPAEKTLVGVAQKLKNGGLCRKLVSYAAEAAHISRWGARLHEFRSAIIAIDFRDRLIASVGLKKTVPFSIWRQCIE